MKKFIASGIAAAVMSVGVASVALATDPVKDRQQMVEYFKKRDPHIEFQDYPMGYYNFNADRKAQFEAAMEFPPYLDELDKGEALWEKDKAVYAKCFGDDPSKIRPKYPYFDEARNEVLIMEEEINRCRKEAGLKEFGKTKGEMAQLSGYLIEQAKGQVVNVEINSPGALKAYELGKYLFHAPRGQLGLSCASCHTYNAGNKARADTISAQLGHTTHFPVFRVKWGSLGTLSRRYVGCFEDMRTKPFKPYSKELKALEFYESFMDSGLKIYGVGFRG